MDREECFKEAFGIYRAIPGGYGMLIALWADMLVIL